MDTAILITSLKSTFKELKKVKIIKPVAWIVFIGYSLFLLYCMFLGFDRSERDFSKEPPYNLIPFKNIKVFLYLMFEKKEFWVPMINLAGNIGVFIPIGFLFPALFKKLTRFTWFSLIFISTILILEMFQLIFQAGTADIDDVILNYIGGIIGWKLFQHFCLIKV